MNKSILYLIQQAGMLIQMPRTHQRNLGVTFDSVASHSFHVALIAYCLAKMEGLSESEAQKAIAMGIFHDIAEARTGDQDFIAKNYVQVDEEKAITDQFKNLDFETDIKTIVEEYLQRESLTSRCTKDADRLQQIYLEWALSWQGNKLADKWFNFDFKHRLPHFYTQAAKDLMLAMKDSDPQEWWWSQFVEKGINSKHLNG